MAAALVLAALAATSVAAAAESPPADDPRDATVVWGGIEHRTPAELDAWLRARGSSYVVWAERHPIAARRLERAALLRGESPYPTEPQQENTDTGVRTAASVSLPGALQMLLIAVAALGVGVLLAGVLLSSPATLALSAHPAVVGLHRRSLRLVTLGALIIAGAVIGYGLGHV